MDYVVEGLECGNRATDNEEEVFRTKGGSQSCSWNLA